MVVTAEEGKTWSSSAIVALSWLKKRVPLLTASVTCSRRGRYRGDAGEMQGRCRGDVGRCRGDIREIQSVLVHLLAALRLDLGGTEVDGPLEERRAQLGGDDVGQGPREHDQGEADHEHRDPVVLVPG